MTRLKAREEFLQRLNGFLRDPIPADCASLQPSFDLRLIEDPIVLKQFLEKICVGLLWVIFRAARCPCGLPLVFPTSSRTIELGIQSPARPHQARAATETSASTVPRSAPEGFSKGDAVNGERHAPRLHHLRSSMFGGALGFWTLRFLRIEVNCGLL